MSREDTPRTIRVSKAVKAALVELRLLEQTSAPPVLDSLQVDRVEQALDCRLPDDLIATLAAQCDSLRDLGLVLERIGRHTEEAHAAGCPKDLIAIGRSVSSPGAGAPVEAPDFFCIPRQGKEILVHEFDSGSQAMGARRGLADWLQALIEQRREDMVAPDDEDPDDRELAELEVGAMDLDSFKVRLVAPPPATGKRVRHATFGIGDVVREIGSGDGRKVEVRFDAGTKVLIARVLEEI